MSFVFDTGVLFSSVVDTVGRVKENVVVCINFLKLLNPHARNKFPTHISCCHEHV